MKTKNIIILIFVALFLIVLFQNTQVVVVRLFLWKISMSRIILLLVTMLIGFVIGYIAAAIGTREHKNT